MSQSSLLWLSVCVTNGSGHLSRERPWLSGRCRRPQHKSNSRQNYNMQKQLIRYGPFLCQQVVTPRRLCSAPLSCAPSSFGHARTCIEWAISYLYNWFKGRGWEGEVEENGLMRAPQNKLILSFIKMGPWDIPSLANCLHYVSSRTYGVRQNKLDIPFQANVCWDLLHFQTLLPNLIWKKRGLQRYYWKKFATFR